MKGPGICQGYRFDDATILDMTPTLLALKGLPIGEDMDGRVITEAIDQDFLEKHPLRYLKSYDTEPKEKQEDSLTSHELEQLEARLRDLGYLG
jgi:arylsulfatase A-like enzyme